MLFGHGGAPLANHGHCDFRLIVVLRPIFLHYFLSFGLFLLLSLLRYFFFAQLVDLRKICVLVEIQQLGIILLEVLIEFWVLLSQSIKITLVCFQPIFSLRTQISASSIWTVLNRSTGICILFISLPLACYQGSLFLFSSRFMLRLLFWELKSALEEFVHTHFAQIIGDRPSPSLSQDSCRLVFIVRRFCFICRVPLLLLHLCLLPLLYFRTLFTLVDGVFQVVLFELLR